MIVVVAVMGAILLVGSPVFRRDGAQGDDPFRRIRQARDSAIRAGARVRLEDSVPGTTDTRPLLFLPDGRVLGSDLDPLTGTVPDARR